MNEARLNEIWTAVGVNAFYCVGCADSDGSPSEITHAEMVELVKLAQDALNGENKKHLRVWWKEGGHRNSGIAFESRYYKDGSNIRVKVDGVNEIKFINKSEVDASEWVDDPLKGYGR